MSGGSLNYVYLRVNEALENLKNFQASNDLYTTTVGVINEIQDMVEYMEEFSILIHQLEWFMSSDTGPEDFKKAMSDWKDFTQSIGEKH